MLEDFYTRDKHETGAVCEIRYPDGSPSRLKIRVKGLDSDVYRRASKRHANQALDHIANRTIEKFNDEKETLQALVDLTIGWNDEDEDVPAFTPEKCLELYREAPYVRDQVDGFIANRANFTKG